MADLHQGCISKFSCDRDSLFNEAEESLLHKVLFRFNSLILPTHPDATGGFNRTVFHTSKAGYYDNSSTIAQYIIV